MTLTDEEIDQIYRTTQTRYECARVIEARVHEKLRKQEPFGNLFPHNGLYNGFCISAPIESLKDAPYGMKLYAAPLPPEPTPATKGGITACPHGVPHCWPCEICDVVPITTPSQQDALDALDNMDDYARMVGLIAIGPIETLRDFILSRPDTEGSGK